MPYTRKGLWPRICNGLEKALAVKDKGILWVLRWFGKSVRWCAGVLAGPEGPMVRPFRSRRLRPTYSPQLEYLEVREVLDSMPVITPPGAQHFAEGAVVSLQITSTADPNGHQLSYSIASGPPGPTIGSTTGLIAGSVQYNAVVNNPNGTSWYTETLQVTQGIYTATALVSWDVTDTPLVSTGVTWSGNEGVSVSQDIRTSVGQTVSSMTYSATSGSAPPGLGLNTATGQFSGTVSYTAVTSGPSATFKETVAATNAGIPGDTEYTTLSWTVTAVPRTVQFSQATYTVNEGVGSAVLTASLTPVTGKTVTVHYSTSDGTALAGLDYASTTSAITFLPSATTALLTIGLIDHTLADPSETLNVAFSAPGNAMLGLTASAEVDILPAISLTTVTDRADIPGDTVSLQLQGSVVPSSHTLTYSETGLPLGLNLTTAGLITGTVSASVNTTALVSVTATDGTVTAGESFNWTIAPLAVQQPADQTNLDGATVSLSLTVHHQGSNTVFYSATGLPGGVSIVATSGLITGTIAATADLSAPYGVEVTAIDGNYIALEGFNWTINPVVSFSTTLTAETNATGDTVSLAVTATDALSHSLTYSASSLPGGLSIVSSTGLITGTITAAASATPFSATVTARDGSYSASLPLSWSLVPIALPSESDQQGLDGQTASLAMAASYHGTAGLTYSETGLPPGLSIRSSTGLITGTIAATADVSAPYAVTVMVAGGSVTAAESFNWSVAPMVSLNQPADQTNALGDTVSLQLAAGDALGIGLTYSASGLPAGLSVVASSGLITGTISATAVTTSPYLASLTASDGTYASTISLYWQVAGLTLPSFSAQNSSDGATISLAAAASYHGTAGLTYSETGLPSGLSIVSSTGLITGTLAASADVSAPYAVSVTASNGSQTAALYFNWSVSAVVSGFAVQSVGPVTDQYSAAGDSVSLRVTATDSLSKTLTYSETGLPAGLSVVSSTGLITGTISTTAASYLPYAATLTARDGTYSATQTLNWWVANMTLPNVGNQESPDGALVSLSLGADYHGTAALTYSQTGLPAGLSIIATSGLITGTLAATADAVAPNYGGYGGFGGYGGALYGVNVTVSDATHTAAESLNWYVDPVVNLVSPGDQANAAGDSVSVQVSATDALNKGLTYSASGLPAGLSIVSSTGLLTGTIATTAASSAPYPVTLTAADGTFNSIQTVGWLVSGLSFAPITDQENPDGAVISLGTTASYHGSGSVTYSVTGLPSGLSIIASTGLVTGTVAATADVAGPYFVSVTASAGTFTSGQGFTWWIDPVVALYAPFDQANAKGDTVSVGVSAGDLWQNSLTYSATGLPGGLTLGSTTGLITGTITATTALLPYPVTLTAGDGIYSATQIINWTVAGLTLTAPGDQENMDGDSVSLSLADSYHGSGTLTFSATGLPSGLTMTASSGIISGTVASTADAVTPYEVSVTASDGTVTVRQIFNWYIDPVVYVGPLSNQSNAAGDTVSLAVYGGDGFNKALTYTASGTPAGITLGAASGLFSGTIALTAASATPYLVTVTASESTYKATETLSWTVSAISLPLVTELVDLDGDSVSVTMAADYHATGTLTYSETGLPPGLSIVASSGLITGSVSATADLSVVYYATLSATDGTASATEAFSWFILPVAQMGPVLNQTDATGDSVSVQLLAADVWNNALTYSLSGQPAGLTVGSASGLIAGTVAPSAASATPYLVTATSSDGTFTATQEFYWTVASIGLSVSDQENTDGDLVSFGVTASYHGTGTLTYTAVNLPAGLTMAASGLISGNVGTTADANGPYTASVTATDGTTTVGTAFTWTIDPAVSFTSITAQVDAVGDTVSLQLSVFDSPGNSVTYSVTGLPGGLSLNTAAGMITGYVPSADAAASPYSVTLKANDGTYTATQSLVWTISAIGLLPPGNQQNIPGDTVSLAAGSYYNGTGNLTYSASGLPPGLSIDTGTGAITGTIATTANTSTPYTASLTATDGINTATQVFTWTVQAFSLPSVGTQYSPPGERVLLQLGATAPAGTSVTYSATGLLSGLSINSKSGVIAGSVTGAGVKSPATVTVSAISGPSTITTTFSWMDQAASPKASPGRPAVGDYLVSGLQGYVADPSMGGTSAGKSNLLTLVEIEVEKQDVAASPRSVAGPAASLVIAAQYGLDYGQPLTTLSSSSAQKIEITGFPPSALLPWEQNFLNKEKADYRKRAESWLPVPLKRTALNTFRNRVYIPRLNKTIAYLQTAWGPYSVSAYLAAGVAASSGSFGPLTPPGLSYSKGYFRFRNELWTKMSQDIAAFEAGLYASAVDYTKKQKLVLGSPTIDDITGALGNLKFLDTYRTKNKFPFPFLAPIWTFDW
jgi:hypothetical protein